MFKTCYCKINAKGQSVRGKYLHICRIRLNRVLAGYFPLKKFIKSSEMLLFLCVSQRCHFPILEISVSAPHFVL